MPHDAPYPRLPAPARSTHRPALGGLSLLLVVALTFGAARAGAALPFDAARDAGLERAAAMLPRTVQQSQRQFQRERPDVRRAGELRLSIFERTRVRAQAGATCPRRVSLLREAMMDLPPPSLA